MFVFINSLIENPAFDSQTKETLTTKMQNFGSKCEPSDKFFNSINKTSLIESIVAAVEAREAAALKRQLGTKQKKERLLGIPKLEDANEAGTKSSSECTLLITSLNFP